MTPEDIVARIRTALPDAQVEAAGADCSFEVLVVSSQLQGQSTLARQRSLLGLFAAELGSGELHALSVRARTPAELQAAKHPNLIDLGTLPPIVADATRT